LPTQTLSPRRGLSTKQCFEETSRLDSRETIADPKVITGCSLSSGERVRVRASVKAILNTT
jgi:hypothetical protein